MNTKSGAATSSTNETEGDIRPSRRISDDPALTAEGLMSSEDDVRPKLRSWDEIPDEYCGGPVTIGAR